MQIVQLLTVAMTPCNITTSLSSLTHFYVSKSLQRNSIIVSRQKQPKKQKTLYWYTFICIYMRLTWSVSQKKKAKDLKAMNYINQRTQNCVEHLAFFPSINSLDSRETFSHDCFACYFGVWISCNTLTHTNHFTRCKWSGFNVISLFIGLVGMIFFYTSKILGKYAFDLIDCKEAKTYNFKKASRIAGDQRINILLETT